MGVGGEWGDGKESLAAVLIALSRNCPCLKHLLILWEDAMTLELGDTQQGLSSPGLQGPTAPSWLESTLLIVL